MTGTFVFHALWISAAAAAVLLVLRALARRAAEAARRDMERIDGGPDPLFGSGRPELPGSDVIGAQAFRTRPGILRPLAGAAVLLALVGPAQDWVVVRRLAVMGQEPEFNGDLAFKMPALVLTGMRGPVVTALWLAAEEGKQNRDWEALQTYYSAIGSLQPHFAQGYLMNGWNSAYNMSAQFNLLAEKYKWVRKGIDLVLEGDRRNPDNIDLVGYLSDLYGDKLGRAFEKLYYGMRFREDTRGFVMPSLPFDQSRGREVDQVTGLALGKPLPPPPPGTRIEEFPCGTEFPYGVSPLGLGWYYSEKARRIQSATGAKHNQFGAPVISSRATLMMRDWAYREHELARYRAKEVFDGRPYELEYIGLNQEEKREIFRKRRGSAALAEEARWEYKFAVRLLEQLVSEYREHVRRFSVKIGDDSGLYTRHMQNAWFDRRIVLGNSEAFEALLIITGKAPGTLEQAAERFGAAEDHYRAALGDMKTHPMAKIDEWHSKIDIGMVPYLEAMLPPGDPETAANRLDGLRDIEYYRSLIKVMGNCRREAHIRRAEPAGRVFSRKVIENLIGWIILKDPPKPLGT